MQILLVTADVRKIVRFLVNKAALDAFFFLVAQFIPLGIENFNAVVFSAVVRSGNHHAVIRADQFCKIRDARRRHHARVNYPSTAAHGAARQARS